MIRYLSANIVNIFETMEDFEEKDKIIFLAGQVLREFARFLACLFTYHLTT
jgi:hypothetical protein